MNRKKGDLIQIFRLAKTYSVNLVNKINFINFLIISGEQQ